MFNQEVYFATLTPYVLLGFSYVDAAQEKQVPLNLVETRTSALHLKWTMFIIQTSAIPAAITSYYFGCDWSDHLIVVVTVNILCRWFFQNFPTETIIGRGFCS